MHYYIVMLINFIVSPYQYVINTPEITTSMVGPNPQTSLSNEIPSGVGGTLTKMGADILNVGF